MIDTHQTAPTRLVEANGIRFAYRRFGLILFDNAGVSRSSGEAPTRIEEMGANAVRAPHLVKRPVLVGAGPSVGEGMAMLIL